MTRQLHEGAGWRLGWQPTTTAFSGLVGTNDWAIELTESEFFDFRRLLLQLVETVEQANDELMEAERLTCEASSELIWLELSGYPDQFSLSFILLSGRRGEGHWPASSTAGLVGAIQIIEGF